MTKYLAHLVQVLYQMLRNGIRKQKLLTNLQLLLRYGKNAGKAISDLLSFHHHHHHTVYSYPSSFLCHSMDPDLAVHVPREIEFSCKSTPGNPSFPATRRRNHHRQHVGHKYDAATIAMMFEVLNSDISCNCSVISSPSPASAWNYGKSPVVLRQLRVTDSPFPINEDVETDCRIDRKAEEFIRRFYEQLRLQEYGSDAGTNPATIAAGPLKKCLKT